ncbi:hypothetical protein C8Q73DRAFT_675749 [Cubamyces lactineus]|nr:hypothetical protein C8Q73DRAFT_675749 [Cubamyces lactineus]
MPETRSHQPLTNADDLINLARTFLEALNKGLRSLPELDKLQSLERIVATSLAIVRGSTNEWRPIHKLPAEVLGRIFQLATPSNIPGFFRCDDFEAMKSDLRARMVISHVCVRWRAVALDMATFWSIVDMTSPPWALAGLERSRAAPMHVFARYPLHNTVAGSLLASQGIRIREFSLEMPTQHQSTVPSELAMVLPPVPNLECLCITTVCEDHGRLRPHLDLEHRPRIFPCPPLRLTRLILSGQCWFPGGLPLGQITHLRLTDTSPCSYPSLVALLRQCILLEEVVLADVQIIAGNEDEVLNERPVELPHLRLLTLSARRPSWMRGYLLRTLVFPPTLILRLFGFEEGYTATRDLPQSPVFTQALDTLVFQDASTESGIIFQAAGPDPSCGLLIDAQRLRQPYTTPSLRSIRQLFFGLMGTLGTITRLTISSARLDNAVPFFPTMPSVVFLRLVDCAPVGLAWNNDPLLSTAFHACVVRFPNLVELQIWSPRGSIRQLPCVPRHLQRYTFYHVRRENRENDAFARSRDSDSDEALVLYREHGVQFVKCDATGEPDVDLPGIRPTRGLSDW